jgi:hypothetical protein
MAPAVRAADSTGQTGPVTAATHSAHTAPATTEPGGRRLPSDPEIETYLEIEAELPPESGLDPELESELALNIVLSGLDDDGSVSIEIDDDDATVPTDIARSSPVLKKPAVAAAAAAPEPSAASEPRRPRTITAQNNAAVSGTISIPDDLPPAEPRRAKRHSEGGGD